MDVKSFVEHDRTVGVPGDSSRLRRFRHCSHWSEVKVVRGSSSPSLKGQSTREVIYKQVQSPDPRAFCSGLGQEGYTDYTPHPSQGVFQSDFLCSQKKCKVLSHSGFIMSKNICSNPKVCRICYFVTYGTDLVDLPILEN